MSSSDRGLSRPPETESRPARRRPHARLAVLALLAVALPACTVAPLYGTSRTDALSGAPAGTDPAELRELRGRISVAPASTRTAQVFRNALLFRLNGGRSPTAPIYEIRYTVAGSEQVVSIQAGSGIPSASLYRMTATYQVVRLSDGVVVAQGNRFATTPFDRSTQLFASSRAVIDARDQAGTAVAERVELAALAAISKDLRR